MRLKGKWIKQVLLSLMIIGILFPQNVQAIDRMDEERPVTLSIDYQNAGELAVGTEARLYKVADVFGFGEFKLAGAFAGYPLSLVDLDAEGFRVLAETLEIYVAKDNIEPDDMGVVDETGILKFPVEQYEMSKGLYLVLSENYIDEQQNYVFAPLLICLPNRDVNDQWVYDETIYPKDGPADVTDELQVVKIWKDSKDEKKRPEEIEVELLMDGEVVQTVKLNEDNNWRYEWKMLEEGHEWKVVEKKIPAGYTVKITKEQTTYIITNTSNPPTPPENPPRLPQTGVLWWPVPILAGVGMVFFMIGWVKRRRFGE